MCMRKRTKKRLMKEIASNPDYLQDRATFAIQEMVKFYSYRDLAGKIGVAKDSIARWVNGQTRMSRDKAKVVLTFIGEM